MVRHDLGGQASVLRTREVRAGWLRRSRLIEVTASATYQVPSRWQRERPTVAVETPAPQPIVRRGAFQPSLATTMAGIDLEQPESLMSAQRVHDQLQDLRTLIADLCQRGGSARRSELSAGAYQLYTELLDAGVGDELAREMIEQIGALPEVNPAGDTSDIKLQLAMKLQAELSVTGPIACVAGHRRVVALVGPTGVGKTTTIAKLAAHYRLRQRLRVGLVTVDTYRIAAVEQLRTYADIMDLPMEVVCEAGEIRAAVDRLADMDLVLMDTAGRSPRDELRIQELQAMLTEVRPDEVHLVLSATAAAASLVQAAEKFTAAGTTAVLVTKLDEAGSLGNLLPLLRSSKLPLSYVTDGQNVPDDIAAAEPRRLSRRMLGMEIN